MLRFLADMGISTKTVSWLKSKGHNTNHLLELNMHTASDEDVLEKARIEKRILLTMDLDFGYLLAVAKQKMPCVVIFRLKNETAENVNHHLKSIISYLERQLDLDGLILSVDEKRIRVRRLPINP
jgi:predicted nuclease of predicted toxin-antitoxin system